MLGHKYRDGLSRRRVRSAVKKRSIFQSDTKAIDQPAGLAAKDHSVALVFEELCESGGTARCDVG
jgi:hypothetical protein